MMLEEQIMTLGQMRVHVRLTRVVLIRYNL